LLADCFYFTVGFVDGDDGGLIDDNTFAFGEDQGVGSAEVDQQRTS
jgi:hypothetical protein